MRVFLVTLPIVAVICLAMCATAGASQPEQVMIQYFEAEWDVIRYRMPDVFIAGYSATWLPPPQRGQGGTASAGYDLWDRFDLGTNASPTHYGTEAGFRRMVDAFHKAHCYVYVDWIMNHNAFKDNSTTGFITQGGYPGFVLTYGGDSYGDFHAYSGGCPQSTNPSDPCYQLFEGRLAGLIDIDQGKNHQMIRHPVEAGNPNNIPAGTIYNKPKSDNRRFYADTALTAMNITNPGTSRTPGPFNFSIHPYNTMDLLQGDPIIENATGLLVRSTQFYLDVLDVDGFRLDAAKHIPEWFWDQYWDSYVYNRHIGFDGVADTPFSFVEAVESNSQTIRWMRRGPGIYGGPGVPGAGESFGNRDGLDLNGAGQLRDIVDADGAGSWNNVLGASLDTQDDGYQNGSIGVRHVNSHDNAIWSGENDTVAFAFALMMPGHSAVYYNALQFGTNPDDFPRANGRDDALGLSSTEITTLVKIHNEYARGYYIPINSTDTVNPSMNDVLVFTRQTPGSGDNLLVAVNDLETNGVSTRNVATNFPVGTRLHELTGNAADPIVDPNNQIPETLVVLSGGRLEDATNPANDYLKIPNNKNANGVFHGRGYVIYGPAVPTGTLSIVNATTTVAPADSGVVPAYRRRLNPVTIVTSSTFDIQLQTNHTDPLDPNTDDLAVFRIDEGFADYNGNGVADYNPGNTSETSPSYGFENFLTVNTPRYVGGASTGPGLYRQTIDAEALGEGYHYITVRAFRHRSAGLDPLFGDFRIVIYVDFEAPDFSLLSPTTTCDEDVTTLPLKVQVAGSDDTIERLHIFLDRREETDFVGLAIAEGQGGANQADRYLNTFTRSFTSLFSGNHRIDVVAVEELPDGTTRTRHKTYTGIQSTTGTGLGAGDPTLDGEIDGQDIYYFMAALTGLNPTFDPASDMDCNGLLDADDIDDFVTLLLAQ